MDCYNLKGSLCIVVSSRNTLGLTEKHCLKKKKKRNCAMYAHCVCGQGEEGERERERINFYEEKAGRFNEYFSNRLCK